MDGGGERAVSASLPELHGDVALDVVLALAAACASMLFTARTVSIVLDYKLNRNWIKMTQSVETSSAIEIFRGIKNYVSFVHLRSR